MTQLVLIRWIAGHLQQLQIHRHPWPSQPGPIQRRRRPVMLQESGSNWPQDDREPRKWVHKRWTNLGVNQPLAKMRGRHTMCLNKCVYVILTFGPCFCCCCALHLVYQCVPDCPRWKGSYYIILSIRHWKPLVGSINANCIHGTQCLDHQLQIKLLRLKVITGSCCDVGVPIFQVYHGLPIPRDYPGTTRIAVAAGIRQLRWFFGSQGEVLGIGCNSGASRCGTIQVLPGPGSLLIKQTRKPMISQVP